MTGRLSALAAAAVRLGRRAGRRPYTAAGIAMAAAGALYFACPQSSLFTKNYSLVVEDRDGAILYVSAASDGQFRFPPLADKLPSKYVTAIMVKEDKRFFRHCGIDFPAVARAAWNNITGSGRKSGASTITMQVARMSCGGKRTYFNKLREMALALKLELHFSKERILRLYAANVPMGGNVVGVETASWRFLGHPLSQITWAEAALISVLPNNPSGMNLQRNRDALKKRRDFLLRRLLLHGAVDSLTFFSAIDEPVPNVKIFKTLCAPHAAFSLPQGQPGSRLRLTIRKNMQERTEELLSRHHRSLALQGIPNIAALVVETATGSVAAYVGSQDYNDTAALGRVDGVRSRRSPGSLLKPFLFVKMLDKGEVLADAKIHDIPTYYGSFAPANFKQQFSGLVSVRNALIQSLNVPAVRCLNMYGLDDFYWFLKHAGLGGLFRSAEGYGLPLILGGCEASLWELTQLYTDLGNMGVRKTLTLTSDAPRKPAEERLYSAGASWQILRILSQLSRPESEYYWRFFNNQVLVAWKTGTSYGQKDAWAIGTNAQWTIGVWSGDFTGRGNASLLGGASSGPLLFMLFNEFTDRNRPMWFEEPSADLAEVRLCASSGYRAIDCCPETYIGSHPRCSETVATCPFHRKFLVSRRTGRGVCSRCWNFSDTAWVTAEIYTPALSGFFFSHGKKCDAVPRHNPCCPAVRQEAAVEILYPPPGVRVFVPRDAAGEYEKVVLRAAYVSKDARLLWYLDDRLIGQTKGTHEQAVDLKTGYHELFVQDEEGNSGQVRFYAVRR